MPLSDLAEGYQLFGFALRNHEAPLSKGRLDSGGFYFVVDWQGDGCIYSFRSMLGSAGKLNEKLSGVGVQGTSGKSKWLFRLEIFEGGGGTGNENSFLGTRNEDKGI
ncbi:hypothetical protein [Pararhodonellum marinum]|uniref:hypothetical protein n=1 Tax=Pararhodonellum marinum TaxID=2755358 RepID=UPI00188E8F9C|nr:hypothetical protein [Pararhodonellum marinum]